MVLHISATKHLFSAHQVACPTTSGLWELLNPLQSITLVRNLRVGANQLIVQRIWCRVAMEVTQKQWPVESAQSQESIREFIIIKD